MTDTPETPPSILMLLQDLRVNVQEVKEDQGTIQVQLAGLEVKVDSNKAALRDIQNRLNAGGLLGLCKSVVDKLTPTSITLLVLALLVGVAGTTTVINLGDWLTIEPAADEAATVNYDVDTEELPTTPP